MARQPRKVTPAYLERAALHYLERFSATADGLRRVLLRRIERSARVHEIDREESAGWAEAVVEKMQAQGWVDDRRFAEGRLASLRRGGASTRLARIKLLQKGVDGELLDKVMGGEEEGAEWQAAIALARRRRIGPWRPPETRAEMRERDLATLARAGFSYDLAKRVVDGGEE